MIDIRVIQVRRFGDPDVLAPAEVPDPVAGPGQVVIEVAAAGITFVETMIRRGVDRWHKRPDLPYVPGGVVAGRVHQVGEGLDRTWLGRRVIGETGGTGGFAELAVVGTHGLIPVPQGLGLPEAAALHTDGSTALGLVEGARILPGERVLVEAAGGGVGSLLVQLSLAAGAQVVGAARGSRKLALIRALGANAVDYSDTDWPKQVLDLTGGAGPDVVFDGVGGDVGRVAFEVTAKGGRFSVHGASSGDSTPIDLTEAERRGVEVIGIEQLFGFGPRMRHWAEQVMASAAAGRIRPVIGQTFPLERAADAHAAIEARTVVGKTLLLV